MNGPEKKITDYMNLFTVELTDEQFRKVSQLVHRLCGIYLKDGKEALVRARLMKRLRALGMDSFDAYLKYIESEKGADELGMMVDVMTTNKTSFFREPGHFHFLEHNILPDLTSRRVRFWTAACSSGEEPFSLAIMLKERIPDIERRDIKILATDISTRMLERARLAVYPEEALRDMHPQFRQKYFEIITQKPVKTYRLSKNIQSIVHFARLNLMDAWPMKGPFTVIFCRNVMIYFDRPTQQKLINRLWDYLEPGGYLFVGHSEGLSAITHKFKYIRPAVYRK